MGTGMKMVSLSDGEWKIMNRLWESGGSTITELTAHLEKETGWDKHSVITMLGRMEKKEAVAHVQETRGFLQKVYRGSLGMMVNAMVADQVLSEQEIQELYDILDQARRKG